MFGLRVNRQQIPRRKKGERMKFLTTRRVLVVVLILAACVTLIFVARSAFRKASIIQHSGIAPQVLPSPSLSAANAVLTNPCDACLTPCYQSCGKSSVALDGYYFQCLESCEYSCRSKCGGDGQGGGKDKKSRKLPIKLRP
jgi:hypothetical protein